MPSLAYLWFQLQMTRQYLREEASPPAQVPADAANWNEPIGIRDPSMRRSAFLPNPGPGTIAISRDLGSKLEISRGLSESGQIVGSPPPWPCGWRRRQRPS
jgi:hypothetical protein